MDARVKALMMLIALSVVPTQSFLDEIFSPPKIAKWGEKIAISERSGNDGLHISYRQVAELRTLLLI